MFSCKQNKNTENNIVVQSADSVVQNQISKPDSTVIIQSKSIKAESQELTKFEKMAYNDIKTGKMKYFYFGMAYPNKAFVDTLKKYNVKLVVKNCLLDPDYVEYNNVILKHINYTK
jgi:hypothetical protein